MNPVKIIDQEIMLTAEDPVPKGKRTDEETVRERQQNLLEERIKGEVFIRHSLVTKHNQPFSYVMLASFGSSVGL